MVFRPLYIIGSVYLGFCALILLSGPGAAKSRSALGGSYYPGTAGAWFVMMKPYCNPVEVETRHQWTPPPATREGASYSAACYALAGKIDQAREIIVQLPAAEQWKAAGVVFAVAHPVADAGDDRSAGPIMELVVEFWPNHYQALYHAGMSRYALGDWEQAGQHLREFLKYYEPNDGWRKNALHVLKELEGV